MTSLMKPNQSSGAVFDEVQRICDEQNLPYPPELTQYLAAVYELRNGH